MIQTMSDDFLDWLNTCPCEWILLEHKENSGSASYLFMEGINDE